MERESNINSLQPQKKEQSTFENKLDRFTKIRKGYY